LPTILFAPNSRKEETEKTAFQKGEEREEIE
jgi:hypothetical protein